MAPKPELLDQVIVEGVNIGQMLRKMNERIEVLLDRDHCLGHAYFMPLKINGDIHGLKHIFSPADPAAVAGIFLRGLGAYSLGIK
jgi:5-methylcytosine-specific restriction protein B